MKAVLGLILITVAVISATPSSQANGVYDYHRRFGIPQAQKIKELEDGIHSGRIVGGSATTTLFVPYQAGLIMTVLLFSSVCGGTIFSENKVLTAAHCYNDGSSIPTSITVVMGSNFLFTGGTRVSDNTVVTHPEFRPQSPTNDIAIVILGTPVTFSLTLQSVELPLYTNELASDYAGYTAVASGYGMTKDGDNIGILQTISSVDVKVISNAECSNIYGDLIQTTHLCTSGEGGVGICGGDTGGPLVVYRNFRRILIGIASFMSADGCEAGLPSGFTRITLFIGWIFSVN